MTTALAVACPRMPADRAVTGKPLVQRCGEAHKSVFVFREKLRALGNLSAIIKTNQKLQIARGTPMRHPAKKN
jgi:hypothetical protein